MDRITGLLFLYGHEKAQKTQDTMRASVGRFCWGTKHYMSMSRLDEVKVEAMAATA